MNNKHNNRNIRESYIKFLNNIINQKILYEMSRHDYSGPSSVDDYRKKCLFSLNFIPNLSGSSNSVYNAQRNIERQFSEYYSNSFRQRCVLNNTVSKRTKFLQPIVITCFDVEGSRYTQGQGLTSMPHYHGVVLLHHDTVDLFFRGICEVDDGYQIVRPAQAIKSIVMTNIPTEADTLRFLDYSTKYSSILSSADANYCPFGFYPSTSKYFPFWKIYSNHDIGGNFTSEFGQFTASPTTTYSIPVPDPRGRIEPLL